MSTRMADDLHAGQAHAACADVRPGGNASGCCREASEEERFRLTQIRAYVLWELAGKPEDHQSRERFWHEAEEAINAYFPAGV